MHELLGHAFHRSTTTEDTFEFQFLGNTGEMYAMLMGAALRNKQVLMNIGISESDVEDLVLYNKYSNLKFQRQCASKIVDGGPRFN